MNWLPLAAMPGLVLFFAAIVLGNVEMIAVFAGWSSVLRFGPAVAHLRIVQPVIASIPIGSVRKNRRVMVKRTAPTRAFFRARLPRSVHYTGEVTWDQGAVDATARWPLSGVLGVTGFGLVLAGVSVMALMEGNASGIAALGAFVLIVGIMGHLHFRSARRQFEEDWPSVIPLLEGGG